MTQAERIIEAFGGVPALSKALESVGKPRDRSQIHRWKYDSRKGGTNGIIPAKVWPDLFLAAQETGVELTVEMLDPRQTLMENEVLGSENEDSSPRDSANHSCEEDIFS